MFASPTTEPRRTRVRGVLLAVGVCAAAVAFVSHGKIQFQRTDFTAVYAALRGFWLGINVYDATELTPIIAKFCPGGFNDLGYPPWFVVGTAGLALLPVDAAGRLWMLVNLWLMLATALMLTSRWTFRARAAAAVAAVLYAPTLFLLYVGQFTMFVTIGAALFIHGARRESWLESAMGLALMSFKPHIGAVVALPAVAWLFSCGRPVLVRSLLIGLALGCASFVVSTEWPLDYPKAAMRLMSDPRNVTCDTCSSAVASLGSALPSSGRLAVAAVIVVSVAIAFRRRPVDVMIAAGVTAALLALPYSRNYDYAVMIVPLLVAWEQQRAAGRLLLAVAWALPFAAIFLPRNVGVYPLWITAVIVASALLWPAADGRERARTRGAGQFVM